MTIETLIETLKEKWEKSDEVQREKIERFITSTRLLKPFDAPTVGQVAAYAAEQKIRLDANEFCDFYQSKGWVVGKAKMKDWKAAARRWSRNNVFRVQRKTTVIPQAVTSTSDGEEMY